MSKHSRKNEHLAVDKQRSAPDHREHVEDLLDRALADTFPASDPVSTLLPDPSPPQLSSDERSSPQ